MKKLLVLLLLFLIVFTSMVTAHAETIAPTLSFDHIASYELIQSLCFVDETLYMLGEDTIYAWNPQDAAPQLLWQEKGIQSYRYYETMPEADPALSLWQNAVSFLFTDGKTLYALQPYSGQLFEVSALGLTPGVSIPQELLTYQEHGQTRYRQLHAAVMLGQDLYLLLGTDDPSDWTKTSLIRFDLDTQQGTDLGLEGITYMQAASQGGLLLACSDETNSQTTYHHWKGEDDGLDAPFLRLDSAAASGAMVAYQDQLILSKNGRLTAYGAQGAADSKAYTPVSAYYSRQIACSKSGLCAVAGNNYVFVRDLSQPCEQTLLHVMGSLNSNDLVAFSMQNPDIALVESQMLYGNALEQAVVSGGGDIDLFVLESDTLYTQMKQKGYLAPLNSSAIIEEKTAAFYESIQAALTNNDQIMAFPIHMQTHSWTLNQTLWDKFDLGDVPTTYAQLFARMQLWQEEYAGEHPDYVLTDVYGDISSLAEGMVKEFILQCDTAYPDFTADAFKNALLSLLEHQEILAANRQALDDGAMPIIYTYDQGFGIGHNDEEKTCMMFMPAISDGDEQKLSASLTLLGISSICEQQEAALRFIAFFAENMDIELAHMLTPALNTPVRSALYEQRLATLTEEKAALEVQLASAEEEDAATLQDALDFKQHQLALAQDAWLVSAQDIDNYRSVAANLVIPCDSPFLGSQSSLEALQIEIRKACDKGLSEASVDTLLAGLNRVAQMMLLEGM